MPNQMEDEEIQVENQDQDQQENQEQQEENQPEALTNNPPPPPAAPSIDYKALYTESVNSRFQIQSELEAIRNRAPQSNEGEEAELTDADIEKYGTVKTLQMLIRGELSKSNADMKELSEEYKMNKRMTSVEDQYFNSRPDLLPYRNVLAPEVRKTFQQSGSKNIDLNSYNLFALATIGHHTLANAGNQSNNQNSQNSQNSMPSTPADTPRNSLPTGRTTGSPVGVKTIRLSELERSAMRQAGYDPNKAEEVKAFMDDINNEEGITV